MLNPAKLKTYLVLKRQAIACSKLTIETLEKRRICSKLTIKTPEQCL